jgi:hypothetical protein
MHEKSMRQWIGRPSPALVIAMVALITSLTGSAWAAFGDEAFRQNKKPRIAKNSVGTRQLKAKAVRTGKIARNAVNSAKVKNNSLTGADINVNKIGVVPSAISAAAAGNANTVGGHAANCPAGSTLIRGLCFDLALNGPVAGVKAAANVCAAKGGYLPTPMELYSVRTVINLGTGIAPDYAVSDQYYADDFAYKTITVDGSGKMEELPIESSTKFICTYELVR